MAKIKETVSGPKKGFVKVKGLRNEDIAVIVNGEVRVIPKGKETDVEERFAREFERSEKAKDIVARNQEALVNEEIR